jgi:hypothetical protein
MFKTKELIRFSEADNAVLLRSRNIFKTSQASEKRNIKISKSIFCFAEAGNCVIQRSWNMYKTSQVSEKRNIKYQNQYFASTKP